MDLNRREFLKFGGAGMGALILLKGNGFLTKKVTGTSAIPLSKRIGETLTICPYDGSGCGFIVAANADKVINIEGDPEHPINRGGGCSKGASLALNLAASTLAKASGALFFFRYFSVFAINCRDLWIGLNQDSFFNSLRASKSLADAADSSFFLISASAWPSISSTPREGVFFSITVINCSSWFNDSVA